MTQNLSFTPGETVATVCHNQLPRLGVVKRVTATQVVVETTWSYGTKEERYRLRDGREVASASGWRWRVEKLTQKHVDAFNLDRLHDAARDLATKCVSTLPPPPERVRALLIALGCQPHALPAAGAKP